MKKTTVAAAALCSSCAVLVFDRQISMDAVELAGRPLDEILEVRGEPHFQFQDDEGTEYVAYRLWTTPAEIKRDRCSVVYAVHADGSTTATTAGLVCHDNERKAVRVGRLADDLVGRSLRDLVLMLGTPDGHELDRSNGTVVYDLGTATGQSAPGTGAGLSLSVSCRMVLTMKDGIVSESETSAVGCFLSRF